MGGNRSAWTQEGTTATDNPDFDEVSIPELRVERFDWTTPKRAAVCDEFEDRSHLDEEEPANSGIPPTGRTHEEY
ncbi:hypothetical protein NQ318_014192 [Aromia moschata]|uniref:Uncharacterized protein n=1 Tax=Aromia moschata TaxID=1265417 RepID=A0AAV8YAF6_9CUCU|nr:hypothetical protein NQ318_014192 [Aromia moschata]